MTSDIGAFGVVEWTVINVVVAVMLYWRATSMGIVPRENEVVLRYLLFQRAIPWREVDRFALEPLREDRPYIFTRLMAGRSRCQRVNLQIPVSGRGGYVLTGLFGLAVKRKTS